MPRAVAAFAPYAVLAVCVVAGAAHGVAHAWTSDDAFISFRYARNLVEGHGLVFNPGERVEGYTNPLWTLFVALGLRLGAAPEAWANGWGLACHAASIGLLGVVHLRVCARLSAPAWLACVPFGALAGAANVEWATFATSGLETAAFTLATTLAALATFAASDADGGSAPRAAGAGALFAIASLLRPDGALFAGIALVLVAVRGGRRLAAPLAFALAFVALWGPLTAWRAWYYGSFLPNTYYAKSGDLAWWSQGLFYVRLYFTRHWLMAAASVALVAILPFARRARPVAPFVLFLFALSLAYTAYVARVGGSAMFARLLIPVTPLLLALLDVAATLTVASLSPVMALPVGVLCAAAPLVTPNPLGDYHSDRGIGDESTTYTSDYWARARERGKAIAPLLDGLPAVVAIYGGEAGLAYYGRLPVAIEAHAGLTDAFVAHLPLARRGRVGHEKLAPLDYLVERRGAQLTFSRVPTQLQGLDAYVPNVHADLGGVRARLLRWDPLLVTALRARGATVEDFPAMLDAVIARLGAMSDDEVAAELARTRRFYFDRVPDAVRERAFTDRLARRDRLRAE